jgi:hypothetical protein
MLLAAGGLDNGERARGQWQCLSRLMTSAPRSANIRVQCGPAMVVEKSSTRRSCKLPVALRSSISAIVIQELPFSLDRTDTRWAWPDGKARSMEGLR